MTDQSNLPVPHAGGGDLSFGQTNLRPQDIVVPRVKVCQQMSKEVADKKAEMGDFFNTLTGENYGPKLRLQPIQPFMNRILLVRSNTRDAMDEQLQGAGLPSLSEGDGLKCRSYDMLQGRGEPGVLCEDECPLSKWRPGNAPPLCTETYNVAAATEIGDLVVVGFSKSSAMIGRRFFTALRMSKARPWTRFFDLATRQERNDRGTFYVPDFAISSEAPATAQIAQATEWARELQGVVIDVSPEDEEGNTAGAGPSPDDADLPF